jgi:hypothetical protein
LISLLVGSGAGLSLSLPVGLGVGLPFALSKSDSPEVTTSGFGFRSGDGSGVDSFPGAENLNSLLLVVVFSGFSWSISEKQIDALGS